MSDAPTTDPTIAEDAPDAPAAEWFDPDIPGFADYSEQEQQLARLLKPVPNTEPEPDPTEPLPVETGDEVEEADGAEPGISSGGSEENVAPTPEPVADPPAPPTPDVAVSTAPAEEPYIELAGRRYPKDQAEYLAQLIDLGIQKVQETPLAPAAPPAPEAPVAPVFDPDQYVDPELARATQAQLEAIRQSQSPLEEKLNFLIEMEQQREAAANQARYADMQAAEVAAVAATKNQFALSDDEMTKLYKLTESSGVVNGLAVANPTDGFEAIAMKALEMVYYGTPEFRERDIQARVQQQIAEQVQDTKIATKKKVAGSLAGGGGSVARTATPKNAQGQPEDPMVAALAASLSEAV